MFEDNLKKEMASILVIDFTAYGVRDAHGNEWGGIVTDASDIVVVYGIRGAGGNLLHFESEAHHLHQWCKDNGLQLTSRKSSVGVTFPQ